MKTAGKPGALSFPAYRQAGFLNFFDNFREVKKKDSCILNLSPHLFWDTNVADLDVDRNKRFIIQRVLEYGLLQDWLIIHKHYGLDTITREVQELRELDERSLAFISALSGVPLNTFRCYTTKQLRPAHWNF